MARPNDLDTLGKRLAAARKRKEWNQTQLAEAAGIEQSAVSKIESGRVTETAAIGRLSTAVGVPVLWLEFGKGPAPEWASADDGSVGEPATDGYTSETPSHFAVIRANLKEPQAELIVRLIVASDCPGVFVEGSEEWITSKVRGRRGGDMPAQMPRQERPKALESTKGKARKGHK